MIHVERIGYVRLGASDLDASVAFAREILGLQLVERDARGAHFRSDDRHHTLTYVAGDPAAHATGLELRYDDDLELAAAELERAGHRVHGGTRAECDERHVDAFIAFDDPTGNRLELVIRAEESPRRFFPSRDAGITGFSHIGLRTSDAPRDETFWTRVLDARVSDWIGEAPLLRVNPVHHSLALFPSPFAGVQHVNHQVASIDDVMRSYYFLVERGVRIRFGPGRHVTSGAVFCYFAGPDDMTYEFSSGVTLIDDDAGHRPRRFPFTPESFCAWGSKPDIPEFRKDPLPALVALG